MNNKGHKFSNFEVLSKYQRTIAAPFNYGGSLPLPHEGEAMIGRVVTSDKATGIVCNFSCPNCCQGILLPSILPN